MTRILPVISPWEFMLRYKNRIEECSCTRVCMVLVYTYSNYWVLETVNQHFGSNFIALILFPFNHWNVILIILYLNIYWGINIYNIEWCLFYYAKMRVFKSSEMLWSYIICLYIYMNASNYLGLYFSWGYICRRLGIV